ncbi:hypothetical protein BVRB_8g185130 [Beta vulgaris subsp. vulgaris]|uniref:Uncharacterized protein n=1 Tax=Beta vulgaris subsp. vulgaris TaxID=3555 RepID=A0A0J8BWB1_BETVV|nr:hypothetical protein BVRB_8g185130 [Beta vulgaris subsp. vulgaris]
MLLKSTINSSSPSKIDDALVYIVEDVVRRREKEKMMSEVVRRTGLWWSGDEWRRRVCGGEETNDEGRVCGGEERDGVFREKPESGSVSSDTVLLAGSNPSPPSQPSASGLSHGHRTGYGRPNGKQKGKYKGKSQGGPNHHPQEIWLNYSEIKSLSPRCIISETKLNKIAGKNDF